MFSIVWRLQFLFSDCEVMYEITYVIVLFSLVTIVVGERNGRNHTALLTYIVDTENEFLLSRLEPRHVHAFGGEKRCHQSGAVVLTIFHDGGAVVLTILQECGAVGLTIFQECGAVGLPISKCTFIERLACIVVLRWSC